MPATATEQAIAWNRLKSISNKWMHNPDFEALRACLAAVKALDIDTTPVWMMLIGPAGTGKTAYYLRCCEAYPNFEMTDEMTVAGLSSGSARNWGQGLLQKLGTRGLWLMPDFTVVLNMKDDRRNELIGIQRRIYDGKYDRWADGQKLEWKGRIHVVSACTPAIERFYRVNADLGERFLQIRIERCTVTDDLVRKTALQREHWEQFQGEILEAAIGFLSIDAVQPTIPFPIARRILDWADFVSMGRVSTHYNYKDELVSIGHEEGASRLCQQLTGLAMADAVMFGQTLVTTSQLDLIERVAMDCLPWSRRAILSWFHSDQSIPAPEVKLISGITHPVTFEKALAELEAIGAILREGPPASILNQRIRLSDRVRHLLVK